jgi:hypothetical protein
MAAWDALKNSKCKCIAAKHTLRTLRVDQRPATQNCSNQKCGMDPHMHHNKGTCGSELQQHNCCWAPCRMSWGTEWRVTCIKHLTIAFHCECFRQLDPSPEPFLRLLGSRPDELGAMQRKTLAAQAVQATCTLALSRISSARPGHLHRLARRKQNGNPSGHPRDHWLDLASLMLDLPLDLQSAFACLLVFAGLKLGTQQQKTTSLRMDLVGTL